MDIRVLSYMDNDSLTLVNGTFGGLTVDFLVGLSLATNLSYIITHPIGDSDWRNASSDAFAKSGAALISGEADLACCDYYYVPERAERATALLPVNSDKFQGFFVQPGLNHKLSGIFYAPFGLVPAIIFYSITLISVVFATCIYWKVKKCLNNPRGFTDSFLKGSWWVLVAYSLKNYTVPSKPTSLQILAITTSFFFYIMNSTYSAFLLSTLTSTLNPVRTFDDLLTFGFSIYSNPAASQFIIKSPKYAKYYTENTGRLNSFRLATKGGHVHVDHSDSYAYFAPLLGLSKEDICGTLSVVPFPIGMSSGIYLRPNASQELRETLNKGIARMGDVGLLYKYNLGYRVRTYSCPRKPHKHLEMGMNYVSNLFEVFGAMGLCSFIIFLAELVTKKVNVGSVKDN